METAVPIWPILVYAGFVILLLLTILGLSYILGQRHSDKATGQPYESGILEFGSARLRLSAQFYLIAMLFVLFDIEVIFVVLWAVAINELGWPGYIGICVFIGLLIAVLIYEWSIGALDFSANGKKILKAYRLKKTKKSAI